MKGKKPVSGRITRVLTVRGALIFYAVIFGGLALMLTRSNGAAWGSVPLVGRYALNAHFSNFALSAQILAAAGLVALLVGTGAWRAIAACAVAIAMLNAVMELFVTVANVRDSLDLVAGLLGICAGIMALVLIDRSGMEPKR